jgi:hypothetical protein
MKKKTNSDRLHAAIKDMTACGHVLVLAFASGDHKTA